METNLLSMSVRVDREEDARSSPGYVLVWQNGVAQKKGGAASALYTLSCMRDKTAQEALRERILHRAGVKIWTK